MIFDRSGKIVSVDDVLLADVPGAGVSRIDPNARSGNPRHDVRSGKFGQGGGGRAPKIPAPANVDPLAFARLTDAVRDAARQFDDFDEGDAQEFLAARARDPSAVDLQAFIAMVREQHVTDLIDILDQQMRGSGLKRMGRRMVKVQAPRGYLQRALRGLEEAEISAMMQRLEARGHDRADVDKFFDKKVGEERTEAPKQRRDQVAASDSPHLQEVLSLSGTDG